MREKVSGVYLIKNISNQRTYVGRSHDILARFAGHIGQLMEGTHSNNHLLNDYQQYGISNFTFQILEVVDYRQPNVNAYLAGLEEKYALQHEAMYPTGYCKLIGDLQSSDVRLLKERIVCYDVRTDEIKFAESFGEAGAMTELNAAAVKRAMSSPTNYKKHHLFFFETDYEQIDSDLFEKKRMAGVRYSNSSN